MNIVILINQMSHGQEVLLHKTWYSLASEGYRTASMFSPSLFFFFYHNYIRSFVMMSIQFLYEDGKEAVVDECGRPKSMDYLVDEKQYHHETLSPYTKCLSKLSQEESSERVAMQIEGGAKDDADIAMRETLSKRNYTLYTDQDKVRFFKLLFEKRLSVSATAKQLASMFVQHKDGLSSARVTMIAPSRNVGRLVAHVFSMRNVKGLY